MARHKTPSKVLELKGAFKKHPERRNHSEPESGEFDKPHPKYFDAKHIRYWNELVSIIPGGVLCNADYYLVVIGTALLVEIEEAKGHLSNERIAKFVTISAKLGLTPSDRAGLSISKKKANKFDDI